MTFNPNLIERLYAISTAHTPPGAIDSVTIFQTGLVLYPNEYGGLLWVPTEEGWKEGLREQDQVFVPILEWAIEHKIHWIKLDGDAPEVDGLPTFDWEH
jgi:hypothetical protein